jgi:hypothetical protein
VHDRTFPAGLRRIDLEDAEQMSRDGHDGEFALVGLACLDRGEQRNGLGRVPDLDEVRADRRAVHRMVLRRRAV